MTDHNWAFVSDKTYHAVLTERNYLLIATSTARRENAQLRSTVRWLLGGLVLAVVLLAGVMWQAGGCW